MLLKSPEARSKSNRGLKTFLIIFVTIVIAIALILLTINIQRIKPKDFSVTFYNKEEIIETVTLEPGEIVSESKLEEINSQINTYDGKYIIEWSYRKNELVPVDFSKLYTNVKVYLFLIKNDYTVKINESELYTYEIIHDGPITYGSDVIVKINPTEEMSGHHMEVIVNGEKQEYNENNTYQIDNIKEDVIVDVVFKEIIEIIPNKESKLVYNDMSQYVTYSLLNKEGKLIESSDIKVRYKNEDGRILTYMKDAGIYHVTIEYTGDEYYCESILEYDVEIEKAIPTLDISNKEFYYDGTIKALTINDLITNSDGEITFINNDNINPGSYIVNVNIDESNNYYSVNKDVNIVIKNGIVNINSLPNVSTGYEYNTLGSIKLEGGNANVPGTFIWANKAELLQVGINKYSAVFIPNNSYYDSVNVEIEVETISTIETLRRIKMDRADLYYKYQNILTGDIYGISDLPVMADRYGSSIIWLSNSNALSVSKLGNISLLNNVDKVDITLVAYITLGNTAEYATFEFSLILNDKQTQNEEISKEVEDLSNTEINVLSLEEFTNLVEQNNEIEIIESSYNIDVINPTPKENIINQYNYYNNKEEDVSDINECLIKADSLNYIYKARCNRKRTISEVILWKVISDSAGSSASINTSSISTILKLEEKQKDI